MELHLSSEEESEEDDEEDEEETYAHESNLEQYLRVDTERSAEPNETYEYATPSSQQEETPQSSNPEGSEEYEGGDKPARLKSYRSLRQAIVEKQDRVKEYDAMIYKYSIPLFINDLLKIFNEDTYESIKE